jgi:pyruvate kinase
MKIKIIATVGPSSLNKKTIQKIDYFGVDYFRINLSHTSIEDFEPLVNKLKEWTDKKICPDTEGAQLRIGPVHNNQFEFHAGQEFILTGTLQSVGEGMLNLNIENPGTVLFVGDILNIDFNGVSVQVVKILSKSSVFVRVLKNGMISSNKGIGIDHDIKLPSFTNKDKKILSIANKLELNTIFLSFCSSGNDVKRLRNMFEYDIEIISKVESRMALKNLPEICHESNSILIDRGDLSRDVQLEKIPKAQSFIIEEAKKYNTPVYIATNLMESMLKDSQPTRAEINDIVKALDSGASGLVLAAETAIGKYPIDTVRILANIISENHNREKLNNFEELLNFSSPLLNEPHGGELIQQFIRSSKEDLASLAFIYVDQKTVTDILQISEGTYSPINRFMCIDEIKSVLTTNSLRDGLAWTMPILLQIHSDKYADIDMNGTVALKQEGNSSVFAIMKIEKSEHFSELNDQLINWFGTEDKNHPGLKDILSRGDIIISGEPFLVQDESVSYRSEYELTPKQSRSLFHSFGWNNIIGFHTRNIPHKGHEYIQKSALAQIDADALFISPLLGTKKPGDFKSEIIIKCYNELINNQAYKPHTTIIGGFNTYSRFCGPREAVFTALCRKNYGCSHFIVGRDHTGVGDYYKSQDSKILFDNLDIGISLIPFGEIFYDSNTNEYVESSNSTLQPNNKIISATQVRELINNNTFEKNYLISDKVYQTLSNFIDSGEELFEQ